MKRILRILISFVLILTMMPVTVFADDGGSSAPKPKIAITSTNTEDCGAYVLALSQGRGEDFDYLYVDYNILNATEDPEDPEYTVVSKNPSVARVEETYNNVGYSAGRLRIEVVATLAGRADIAVTIGDATAIVPVVVLPYGDTIQSVSQAGYQKVSVKWTPFGGMTGYQVQRSIPGKGEFQTVGSFPASAGEGIVSAPIGTRYEYRVRPYIRVGNTDVCAGMPYIGYSWFNSITYQSEMPGTALRSVTRKSTTLTLTWDPTPDAVSYEVYRSGSDNGTYKKVATVKGKTTWSQKVKKGVTYCYRVKPVFADKKLGESANSLSQFIPKAGKAIMKKLTKTTAFEKTSGQYHWNWASPDSTYYYKVGNKTYVVCLQSNGKTLKVYGLNSKDKIVSTKTVKLPKKTEMFGGFYHGEDGNFYVAVGYGNPKESKTKTVIQVIQYNKKWKKLKTASIKGGASNYFEGIYIPFDAANVSFAMQGTTLYLFTGREMFLNKNDGLHHQSNISFAINTKTMKAEEANESYASHSFNQRARFKDGDLYLVDHGDAYPRSIALTTVTKYQAGKNGENIQGVSLFDLHGNIGDNFTGCKLAGMEVGAGNVITVGTAQPHSYKVGGKKGFQYGWEDNLFVAVTNRKTGKTSVKWLTKYKPTRKKNILGEARLVKLSDYRFAVLVSIDGKLHYYALDQNGKQKVHKTYKSVRFSASSQPIVQNGKIIWREPASHMFYARNNTWNTLPAAICRIPAL